MSSPKHQLIRENGPRDGTASNDDGTASNDNLPPQMSAGRGLLRGLPWAWIALSVLATLSWLIGIGWIAVKLFLWLAG
jgi:hypothetical protein